MLARLGQPHEVDWAETANGGPKWGLWTKFGAMAAFAGLPSQGVA